MTPVTATEGGPVEDDLRFAPECLTNNEDVAVFNLDANLDITT